MKKILFLLLFIPFVGFSQTILVTQIEVKNEIGQLILDVISEAEGYDGFVEPLIDTGGGGDSTIIQPPRTPQTKQEFLQKIVLSFIYEKYKGYATLKAGRDAAQEKKEEVDATVLPELTKPKP